MRIGRRVMAAALAAVLLLALVGAALAEQAGQIARSAQAGAASGKEVPLSIAGDTPLEGAYFSDQVSYGGVTGLLRWTGYGGEVTYSAQVPEAGDYYLTVGFIPLASKSDFVELSVAYESGGEEQTLGSVLLERTLRYGEITTDEFGGDLRADSWVEESLQYKRLRSRTGMDNDAMVLHLERGEVAVTLSGRRTDLLLHSLTLTPAALPAPYAGASSGYTRATEGRKVQAEDIYRASESTLTAQYDRSDALVEPTDPGRMVLNIAGGENWRADGQWMEWLFDVPQEGLYAVRVKARQSMKSGLASNRRLYIDGAVPCLEAYNMAFAYSTSWQLQTLETADGETVLIPLTAGEHILRLEVVPGTLAQSAKAMQAQLGELNRVYRQIIMVTGTSPDANRDYYLEREIPQLIPDLEQLAAALEAEKTRLETEAGQKGDELAVLTTLATQLRSLIEKPETIPGRVNNLKGNIDALGTWLLTLSEQPLDLDYLMLAAPDAAQEPANAGFFQNLAFGAQSLVSSFFPQDSGRDEEGALRVWVSMGRDQMQILKQLTDDGFTPSTGIRVEFSVVQQGINEAILAGSGPDVVLYAANSEAVSLAMRGALAPLSEQEDFDALALQLQSESLVPYTYKEQVYGLPFTQQYPMLFYRADILTELGLEVPTTWEELYAAIPVIQRKNMQMGVPSGEVTYATLLFQRGSEFYNETRTATRFSENTAVEAFTQYTRLFSDYGLPLTYDFFNRFRSGEMPLAIADYTEYNRLAVAAPEIAGLWAMAPMPGTWREDGSLDRSVAASGGQGGYLLSDSGKQDEAWQFLRWFASGEVQADFGRKSEALLGAAGRYPPANREAFSYLPWLTEEAALLEAQWDWVRENPQLPGAYYTPRNLANAFRNVVMNNQNPREMLERYGAEIDRELARKWQEYNRTE